MATAAEIQILVEMKNKADAEIRRLEKSLGDVEKEAGKSSGALGKLSGVIGGVGKAAALAATGGIVALGAGIAGTIKTAASFQQSLANVGAATGATADEMKAMRAEALKIGADTSKGAGEAVEAMGELTKSGISVKDVVGGVGRTVVELSEATGSSVANMATLVSDSMNIFKISAGDSADAANTLAKAAGASSISIDDMGQSLAQGGLVAKGAGLDINQFATAIGIMGSLGLKASDAGTSLKSMISGLTPATKEGKKAFDELGISVFDAQGKWKPFPEILNSLSQGFAGLTEKQRATTAELIFGSDGIRAFNALVPDTSKGLADAATQWGAFTTAMSGAPSIAEQSAARLATLGGVFEQLKGSLETIAIEVGSVFLPVLTSMIGWVADHLPGAFEVARAKAGELAGAIATLGGAVWERIGPLASAAATAIINGLGGAVSWVRDTAAPAIVGALSKGWETVEGPVKEAAKAITDALSGAKQWVDQNWPGIKTAIIAAFQDEDGAIGNALEVIRQKMDDVISWSEQNWPRVKSAIGTAFEGVGDTQNRMLQDIISSQREVIAEITKDWQQFGESGGGGGANQFEQIMQGVFQRVQGFASEAWNAIQATAQVAWDAVVSIVKNAELGIVNTFFTLIALVRGEWALAWQDAKEAVQNLVNVMLGGQPTFEAIEGVSRRIDGAIRSLAGGIASAAGAAVDAIPGFNRLRDALGSVGDKLGGLGDIIKRSPVPLAEGIRDSGDAADETFPRMKKLSDELGSVGKQAGWVTDQLPPVSAGVRTLSTSLGQVVPVITQAQRDLAGLDVAIAKLRVELSHTEAYSEQRREIEKQIQFLEGWRGQIQAVETAQAALTRQTELGSVAIRNQSKDVLGAAAAMRELEREEARTEARRQQSVELDRIREENRGIADARRAAADAAKESEKALAEADAERRLIMALPGGTSPFASTGAGGGMAPLGSPDERAWIIATLQTMAGLGSGRSGGLHERTSISQSTAGDPYYNLLAATGGHGEGGYTGPRLVAAADQTNKWLKLLYEEAKKANTGARGTAAASEIEIARLAALRP